MPHNDSQILRKILNEIDFLEGMLAGVDLDSFENDEIVKRASAMAVINIGELAKHLSEDFFENHPEAELHKAAKTRDVYAHGYFKLDAKLVFQTATEDVTQSKAAILKALEEHSTACDDVPERNAIKLTPEQAEKRSRSRAEILENSSKKHDKTR